MRHLTENQKNIVTGSVLDRGVDIMVWSGRSMHRIGYILDHITTMASKENQVPWQGDGTGV